LERASLALLRVTEEPERECSVAALLASVGTFGCTVHTARFREIDRVLASTRVDAVLLHGCGGGVPDRCLNPLSRIRKAAPAAAVLVLTSGGDEAAALEALRNGAEDVLRVEELDAASLLRSVRHAILSRRHDLRSEYLSGAVEALAESLDADATLRALAHLVVPFLADYCVIELLGPSGELAPVEVVASSLEVEALLRDKLRDLAGGRRGEAHPVSAVLRTGEARLLENLDTTALDSLATDERHLAFLRELSPRSMLLVPLTERGIPVGVMSLATTGARRYATAELELARQLAERASVALAHGRQLLSTQRDLEHSTRRAERLERLQEIVSRLARSVSPEQVVTVLTEPGLIDDSLPGSALFRVDPDGTRLELLAANGLPTALPAPPRVLGLTTGSPLHAALRTRSAALLTPAESGEDTLVAWLGVEASSTALVLPLLTAASAVGVMVLPYPAGRTADADAREYLRQLGRHGAEALDRAMLYQRERDSRAVAQDAIRLRDEVLGIVAHDLRNPLSVISTLASLLGDEAPTSEQRGEYGRAIEHAVLQMDRLIGDLLTISRLESGGLAVDPAPVEVESLLRDAVASTRPASDPKEIVLEWEVSGDALALADPTRIRQVLVNLLGNAVKFTPRGGSVWLRAEALPEDVLFLVSDSGPGVAPGDLPHLFERFWQARHARNLGSGLGLTIAKGLVERHGGRIGVESRLGVGSTFFFTIPAAPAAGGGSAPTKRAKRTPPTARLAEGRPARVLVVDDHPAIRRGIVHLLSRTGRFEVVAEADSVASAVAAAEAVDPDVALVDLVLPDASGVEAIRSIEALGRGIRTLAVTAEPEERFLLEVLGAGASGILPKTRVASELVPALEMVLKGEVYLRSADDRLILRDLLRRSPDEPGAADPLSSTEREVIRLSALGHTSAEISRMIYLSPRTVDTYRSRCLRKLGLAGRAELVAFALRSGILQVDPPPRRRPRRVAR
jgi:signal transduction histidine kinase/DNA-binding NarL/FixJ family response regulator